MAPSPPPPKAAEEEEKEQDIGIIVGPAVGGVVVLGLGAYLYRRQRVQQQVVEPAGNE